MKRKLFLTLLTSAALAGTQAGGMQNDMPRENEQQEQHVIASPNPTVDDSRTPGVAPGKISSARVRPASATTATPMKKQTRPKRKRARKRRN